MKKILLLLILLITINIVQAHDCNENKTILKEGECDIKLTLETDKLEYKNQEKILIDNKLTSKLYNFNIDYWIEYNNGTILKNITPTTNTNTKQFTPKLQDSSFIVIKNNLTYINCTNINNQTYNEVKVFIEVEKDQIPKIEIIKLYLNRSKKIEIGYNLTALVSVYSGNNTNYSLKTFIENLTEEREIIIEKPFNYSEFNITIPIENDCKINNGTYNLILKSKDQELKEDFIIINHCKLNITKSNITLTSNETNSSESVINVLPNAITGKTVYESTNVKAKSIATYAFMVVLATIMAMILIGGKSTNKIVKNTTKKWSSLLERL